MPLALKVVPSGSSPGRFILVVSRAVSKKAAARNLLKRRAREVIRKNLKAVKPGRDVFLIFKKNSDQLAFRELEEEILKAFRQSGLCS